MEPKEKVFSTLLATSALVSGTLPAEVQNQKNVEKEEPSPTISEKDPFYPEMGRYDLRKNHEFTEEVLKTNDYQYLIEVNRDGNKIIEKERAFPYEELDFLNLAEYSLASIENIKEKSIIQTEKDTVMYLIPLDLDHTLSNNRDIKQFTVKPGINFEVAQNRILIDNKGNNIEISLLANTYGGKNFVAAVVNSAIIKGEKTDFVSKNNEEIEGSATYIFTEDSIYPNKVSNVLKAFAHFTQEQPLKAGEEYSYISMIGLNRIGTLKEYDYGKTGGGSTVYAGGVCATATGVSSLLSRIEGVTIPRLGVGRWTHSVPYAQGPFSGDWKNLDAAVSYDSDNEKNTFDLIWKMDRDGYIKIDTELIPSGMTYEDTDKDGIGRVSDVLGIVSLSFTKERPVGQEEALLKLRDEYKAFRDSKHEDSLPYQGKIDVKSFSQDQITTQITNLLYTMNQSDIVEPVNNNDNKYKYNTE